MASNAIFPFHNVNDIEFNSILSTCDEILPTDALNRISVQPIMHNEGVDDATTTDNLLVEALNFKNPKCDYVYPESSVIGYSSKRCLSMFGFNINSMPENFEEFISINVVPLQFSFDFVFE